MDSNNKRRYRQLDDFTKKKISQSLKGKSKSTSHIHAISQGLINYWQTVPDKPQNNNDNNIENTDEQDLRN